MLRFAKSKRRRRIVRFPLLVVGGFAAVFGTVIALQQPSAPVTVVRPIGAVSAVSAPAPVAGPRIITSGSSKPAARSSPWPRCGARRDRCVIDGDTIRLNGTTIRIADIDAPETGGARCASEKQLGDRATFRLAELLGQGPITLRGYDSRDVDRYGRSLRVVERDGRSLGSVLVAEGLARPWTGRRRSWC